MGRVKTNWADSFCHPYCVWYKQPPHLWRPWLIAMHYRFCPTLKYLLPHVHNRPCIAECPTILLNIPCIYWTSALGYWKIKTIKYGNIIMEITHRNDVHWVSKHKTYTLNKLCDHIINIINFNNNIFIIINNIIIYNKNIFDRFYLWINTYEDYQRMTTKILKFTTCPIH